MTVIEAADRVLPPEEPEAGEVVAAALREDGVEVRTGAKAVHIGASAATMPSMARSWCVSRTVRRSERPSCWSSVGRRARVKELGVDTVGLDPEARAVEVDERMRAGERLWAVGDVTGVGAFTHIAMYQAGIAIADILGERAPTGRLHAAWRG